jgi:hypothetical protein
MSEKPELVLSFIHYDDGLGLFALKESTSDFMMMQFKRFFEQGIPFKAHVTMLEELKPNQVSEFPSPEPSSSSS